MQPDYHTTISYNTIIDEQGSLTEFYSLTDKLSQSRHVRFTSKNDEADNIEWHFKYRGHHLTLQYNIYNGVSLYPDDQKDIKAMNELAGKLKSKKAQ